MPNITLGWNNRTDSGTLSGGSWLASLPLTNLQNRQVQKVARSTNAAVASTQFQIDLGQARSIGVLGLVVHNISVSGRVRVTGGESASAWTNLLTFPNDFDNAVWTKGTCTVTANATTAPDGTATADRLTATGSDSYAYQNFTIGAAAQFTCSVWLRADTTTNIQLNVRQFPSNTDTSISVTVTASWQKFTITGTTVSGTTSAIFAAVGSFGSFTTGEVVYAWGAETVLGNGSIYDSGWVDVWPTGMIPQNLLEWEDDNFWLGTLSANARAGYQSPFIHLLSTAQNLRYWRVEIADTTNTDGYVQIGRLFTSSVWTPSVNYSYGAGLGYLDPTPVDTSLSGAEFFDVRSRYRVFNFELQYIEASEAYAYALELQRLSGNSGEVLVVPDRSDTANQPYRSFVGRLLQMGEITQPQPSTFSTRFQVKELL
jgi:hypothetical protein